MRTKSKYKELNDEAWLREKYIIEGLGIAKISDLIGVKTSNSVRQSLIRFGIKVRNISEGLTNLRKSDNFILNDRSLQVLNGCLLGDGFLRCHNKRSEISNPYFSKANKFRDHVELISKELSSNALLIDEKISKCNGKEFIYYSIRSLSHKELKPIYNKWYPEKNGFKKCIPTDLKITPLVLQHWFMDDGCSYRRKRKYIRKDGDITISENQIVITFSSESFSKEDQILITEKINYKYGLNARVGACQFGTGWRIFIPQSKAKSFFEIIGPCPVKSMEYKWKI